MKVAVIGAGYWGPNLVRNAITNPRIKTTICCDLRSEPLEALAQRYPGLETTCDLGQLENDSELDCVMIATPVDTHYELATRFLSKGKHVFVEKPLASQVEHAVKLDEQARKAGLVFMVDHTYLYHPAVQEVYSRVKSGELGTPHYYESNRTNLGLFQRDVNVIWDLAPHDFSILLHLVDELPTQICTHGTWHYREGQIDHAHIHCSYDSCFTAHVHVSWLSPVKIRQIILGGDKKMLLYDDIKTTEKVKIYDSGVDVVNPVDAMTRTSRFRYRFGGVYSPVLTNVEPLSMAVDDFITSVKEKKEPLSSSTLGVKVVKLLQAANLSLNRGGAPQKVE